MRSPHFALKVPFSFKTYIAYLQCQPSKFLFGKTQIFDRQTMFNRFTPFLFFLNQQRQVRSCRHDAGQFRLELHPLGIKLNWHHLLKVIEWLSALNCGTQRAAVPNSEPLLKAVGAEGVFTAADFLGKVDFLQANCAFHSSNL